MFAEQWSVVIVNTTSLIIWIISIAECIKLFIFLYKSIFKIYNFIFVLIISFVLIIFSNIKINNISFDDIIPILAFLINIGSSFCKSIHFVRIFKGIVALMYFYYNMSYNIIFSAAQNLFVILLMIADILINKFDEKTKILKKIQKKLLEL